MNCKNCQTELAPQSGYCRRCGAKVIRNRLTLKNLIASFSAQFFNYDNKFFQTFISLFKKPEDVIEGYINGTRKKYVNVISYFMIALTLVGIEYFFLNKFYPNFMSVSSIAAEGQEEMTNSVMKFIQNYQSIFTMLLIPLYAVMSRLVFLKNKKFNYTEHIVIFMYIMAQLSIIGIFLVVPFAIVGGPDLGALAPFTMLIQIVYSAYCLKRLYNFSLGGIILRTLLFLAILAGLYILITIIFIAIIFAIGGKEALIELGKSANQGG